MVSALQGNTKMTQIAETGTESRLKMSDDGFSQEARILLAAKLYALGEVSGGVAAQLAGMDRLTFLTILSRYGVAAINLKDEEVAYEVEAARRLAGE